MAEVTIYTKPGCPYCAGAKESFDQKGIDYTEISVPGNSAALEQMLQLTKGVRKVPIIVEGDKVTIGFNGGG